MVRLKRTLRDSQIGDKAALVTRLNNLAVVFDMRADIVAALKRATASGS